MTDKTKKTPPKPKKLSDKHLVFCEEYIKSWNATEAYHIAYPKATRASCATLGLNLLRKVEIQAYKERRLAEMVMSSNEVLKRLSDIAQVNWLPFIRISEKNGAVYFDFSHPDATKYMHLIKKIKTKRTRRVEGHGPTAEEWEDEWVEVELHDQFAALVQVGKYHKLFTDNVDLKSDGKALPAASVVQVYIPDNSRSTSGNS